MGEGRGGGGGGGRRRRGREGRSSRVKALAGTSPLPLPILLAGAATEQVCTHTHPCPATWPPQTRCAGSKGGGRRKNVLVLPPHACGWSTTPREALQCGFNRRRSPPSGATAGVSIGGEEEEERGRSRGGAASAAARGERAHAPTLARVCARVPPIAGGRGIGRRASAAPELDPAQVQAAHSRACQLKGTRRRRRRRRRAGGRRQQRPRADADAKASPSPFALAAARARAGFRLAWATCEKASLVQPR